jgi:hypothetical protein
MNGRPILKLRFSFDFSGLVLIIRKRRLKFPVTGIPENLLEGQTPFRFLSAEKSRPPTWFNSKTGRVVSLLCLIIGEM